MISPAKEYGYTSGCYTSLISSYDGIIPDFEKARTRCEQWIEKNGIEGKTPPAMAIFALKNYGWTDKPEKQEIDDTANDLSILQQALGIDS